MITSDINFAVNLLNNGAVVAIPTETVYGLAADSTQIEAVQQIFVLKQRPQSNPLILHFASKKAAFAHVTEIPEAAQKLADHFWPGALTLVLPKKSYISDLITANQNTVAIRVPAHSITQQLLSHFPNGLVAPSANKYMQTSTTTALDVQKQFDNEHLNILDGGSCENGLESTIVAFQDGNPVVLRYGAITVEQIAKALNREVLQNIPMQTIVPGMHKKHYAPKAHLIVTETPQLVLQDLKGSTVGYIGTDSSAVDFATEVFIYQNNNLDVLATHLYRLFHQYDSKNYDYIVVEKPSNDGLGQTINDRLKRAAVKL